MSAAAPGALASAMLAAAVAGRADPARFGRGRTYVRDGAVIDIAVSPGVLNGSVMGSRSRPYQVNVRVPRLPPLDTDGDGTAVGVLNHLVPQPREMRSDCSCPDDAEPCKHAVAVLLAFAQQVAIHPGLLATWRIGGGQSTAGDLADDPADDSSDDPAGTAQTSISSNPAPDGAAPVWSPGGALAPAATRAPALSAPKPPRNLALSPEAAAFLGDPRAELPGLPDLEPLPLGAARVDSVDVAAIVADALELIRSTYYDRSHR